MNGIARIGCPLLLASLVSGCGGGSNDTSQPPPSPTASLSVADASVAEGNTGTTSLSFSVSVANAGSSAITVNYATTDGNATAGSDYTAANGTLSIPANTAGANIDVQIVGDTLAEIDESFTLTLSNASNATISDGSATGTIENDDAAPVFGLDVRPDNQTCVAPARTSSPSGAMAVDAFPGVTVGQPIKLVFEPVASNPRLFVAARAGQILTIDPASPAAVQYLNIASQITTTGEGGLLGMDFHPDYPGTPELFVSYTSPSGGMRSVLSRIILDNVDNPSQIGMGSVEQVILTVEQPYSNHNGGDIAFGQDGYLYFGLGDGGGGGDPDETGQDPTNWLGSFLRIDVTGPSVSFPSVPYAIPPDNPFANQAKCNGTQSNPNNCPEIFAWGFRNPFRWSFDEATGDLWAGDVGQGSREEIDIVTLGGNFGWDCKEGFLDFETTGCSGPFDDPEYDYGRTEGNSITGGRVYRGGAIAGRFGEYFYADYGSGRVWSLRSDGQGGYINEELFDGPQGPVAFAADAAGELYIANIANSRILKLVPDGTGGTGGNVADLLSDSGCVDPTDVTRPYAGLLPYDINAPFWSDGADKTRFIGLPNGTAIDINAQDDWDFPPGTVIVKNFSLGGQLIETRHLMRHPDGAWAGYTYEWLADQSDARRVNGGKTVSVNGQDWIFPSAAQCDQCHTVAAGVALGPETAQMNRDFTYASTGRTANHLSTIDHVMMFSSPLAGSPDVLPALADPADTSADIKERARAYLHTNCANCHRPNGGTPVSLDLRYDTALANTNACDVAPSAGNLGVPNARIIAPGDAAASTLVLRANRRDGNGMPPLGSTVIDTEGVNLLTAWVNGLSGCQ